MEHVRLKIFENRGLIFGPKIGAAELMILTRSLTLQKHAREVIRRNYIKFFCERLTHFYTHLTSVLYFTAEEISCLEKRRDKVSFMRRHKYSRLSNRQHCVTIQVTRMLLLIDACVIQFSWSKYFVDPLTILLPRPKCAYLLACRSQTQM